MNDLAVPCRTRSRMGAWLLCDSVHVQRDQALQMAVPAPAPAMAAPAAASASPDAASAYARLRPRTEGVLFGTGIQVAGQAFFAGQQHTSNVKYAQMTRIATKGGGSLGPHSVRDPV
jgi:hypothetical protein